MRFHARVGLLPHEREHPQPIEVDVTVWRARAGPANEHTVLDYRGLYDIAARAVATDPLYLEEIGDAAAAGALASPGVERVRVAVRKPHVGMPGPLAHAEVVVERTRGA